MNNNSKKTRNYISGTFWFSITTMFLLFGFWFLPQYSFGDITTRRVNIVSEIASDSLLEELFMSPTSDIIVDQNTPKVVRKSPSEMGTSRSRKSITVASNTPKTITEPASNEIKTSAETISQQSQPQPHISVKPTSTDQIPIVTIDTSRVGKAIDPPKYVSEQVVADNNNTIPLIENSDETNFANFKNRLSAGKNVRIAVLGDSFIEGDIFTQDVRENLQNRYGGKGVGYVPITSNVAGFRQSVEHKFNGWSTKCITNNKGEYGFSGYIFTPSEGAWVQYKGSAYRENLDEFSRVKFLFVNKGSSKIVALVNDTIKLTFTPSAGEQLQSIVIDKPVRSVRFTINNVAGFSAYGAVLDGTSGVSVDNYSIRSYSGNGLINLSKNIADQTQKIMPYDLIILQYGLNVANEGTTNYSVYGGKLFEIINNLKRVLPNCAILVMSVSDRQNRSTGKTMPAIYALERTQRSVAQQCDVAFWSTLYAMQNGGGMSNFVKKGWAAKDYTHLSARGGKVVADAFVEALESNNQ